jgi:2-methylcitrate dehydratase PrpD
MGKPFNAGISAANGIEAAALAKRGFTSCDDGIAGPQGFIDTHSDAPEPDVAWKNPPPGTFLFEEVKYKLHACCHGTHAMIEALLAAKAKESISPDQVAALSLRVNPRWLKVCDIKAPRTGLEVKFSYVWLAGMVFHGIDTASDATYDDALGGDPQLAAFARRVMVAGDDRLTDTETEGELTLASGARVPLSHDLAARLPRTALESRLRAKARALIGAAAADELWTAVVGLEARSARQIGALLRAR